MTPTCRSNGPDHPDLRDRVWYQFVLAIDDLLATGRFTWAEDTLRGIQDTVHKTHRVTMRQRLAVADIEMSRQ